MNTPPRTETTMTATEAMPPAPARDWSTPLTAGWGGQTHFPHDDDPDVLTRRFDPGPERPCRWGGQHLYFNDMEASWEVREQMLSDLLDVAQSRELSEEEIGAMEADVFHLTYLAAMCGRVEQAGSWLVLAGDVFGRARQVAVHSHGQCATTVAGMGSAECNWGQHMIVGHPDEAIAEIVKYERRGRHLLHPTERAYRARDQELRERGRQVLAARLQLEDAGLEVADSVDECSDRVLHLDAVVVGHAGDVRLESAGEGLVGGGGHKARVESHETSPSVRAQALESPRAVQHTLGEGGAHAKFLRIAARLGGQRPPVTATGRLDRWALAWPTVEHPRTGPWPQTEQEVARER